MIQIFLQMEGVMVNIFLLVSVVLDHTRFSNSRDLRCALIIQLKTYFNVDKVARWGLSGSDMG